MILIIDIILHVFFIPTASWTNMNDELAEHNIQLKGITPDLIDSIWTTGRPPQPNSNINVLPLQFSGTWPFTNFIHPKHN